MTGYDIYKRAEVMLCTETGAENIPESLPAAALDTVNNIGNDLIDGFHLNSIYEEAEISEETVPAFCYGVAMMLSAILGLAEKNAFFCELYNAKRSAVKAKSGRIKNVIPTV